MLLADKVAVVTGVGAGLGKAAALALAREGAAVGLVARTESRLDEVAREIEAAGGRAVAVPGNVAKPEDCERVAATVADALGGIDILVNSAFRGDKSEPFESADLTLWRKVFDVNLWGALQLAQACVPALKARGGGSIVNIASMSARLIRPNDGGYSTSKGALLTATKSLAIDLAPDRIRVNAVVPGWIKGPNVQMYIDWQTSSRGITEEAAVAEITANIPLGEIPPQEDIAEAIVFFASDMSRMITGQSLDVNGGEFFGMTDGDGDRRKVALVTGGGSGLGRATAVAFAEHGSRVLVADVDDRGGKETIDLVRAAGSDGLFIQTDVTNPEAVAAMVAACVAAFGSVDYAVNNAGTTGPGAPTADYEIDDWKRVLALNLDSVFYCLKAEIPVMLGQGGGAIVNVASGAGLVGFAGLPAYVSSKHGVVGLTRASALEYAAQGIRINCVCPGSTRTPMLEGFMGGDERVEKMMRNAVPMRRLGRPEEIAAAIVWLCSDAASFVVGHALAVDGGSVIQ